MQDEANILLSYQSLRYTYMNSGEIQIEDENHETALGECLALKQNFHLC